MQPAVSVDSVSKQFLLRTDRPRTLKESMLRRIKGTHDPGRTIWALKDVSFAVEHGRAVGIIGHNGAGKSTLLRLLCGIGRPTSGSIQTAGPVSGLLELGTTFQQLMSGRENIRTAAMLNGLSRRQVLQLEREMIEFAELEDFIDQPVRTYSAGMSLRLAFSAAIHFHPEILVIDEILVVGDIRFQKKCEEKLKQFRSEGKTLILAAHDMEIIEKFCDEVLVLENGHILAHADPQTAVAVYKGLMRARTEKRTKALPPRSSEILSQIEKGFRTGTQEISIRSVHLFDSAGDSQESFSTESGLAIELEIEDSDEIDDFAITVGIYAQNDVKCYETFIGSARNVLGYKGGKIRCHFPTLPLLAGEYFANVGLYPTNWEFTYDYHREMHSFRIDGDPRNASGLVSLSPNWSLTS